MTMIADRAGAQRRFGFVSILWTIAFVTSLIDSIENHQHSILRIVFLVVSGFFAVFFTYTWRKLRKGSDL